MTSKVKIISGVERNRQFPDSFWIPPKEAKDAVRPGHYAKMMFKNPSRKRNGVESERMWVLVTARDGDNFVGELANDPVAINPDLFGEGKVKIINFTADHIIDIMS